MKVLFIPHSPLQFEVFSFWAESLKEKNISSICLLITNDLVERLNSSFSYDEIIKLQDIDAEPLDILFEDKLSYLKSFENSHSTADFAVDWTIDRAFQQHYTNYNDAVSFTFDCVKRIEFLFNQNNILLGISEKLFLPQRIVHHILINRNRRHLVPIGDRFFKRFYFEGGLNDWSYDKIQIEYNRLGKLEAADFNQEVIDVFDKIVYKKYKKVFSDANNDKVKKQSILSKIKYRFKKREVDNIYSKYLFSKRSFFNVLKQKRTIKNNTRNYTKITNKEFPKGRYILFMFHLQPEYTVDGIAFQYFNQVELVATIAKFLPVDVALVIKENPRGVGKLNRPISYYGEIERHPNIKFLHHSLDSHKLIKNSEALITLSGTAGLEAMFFNVPVFILGKIFYRNFNYFQYVDSLFALQDKLEKLLNQDLDISKREINKNYGQLVLQAFYDASYEGQMYNGFSPNIHRNVENIELLKIGFKNEVNKSLEIANN